jgi:thiol-disulfide isomerase/thioredoxin
MRSVTLISGVLVLCVTVISGCDQVKAYLDQPSVKADSRPSGQVPRVNVAVQQVKHSAVREGWCTKTYAPGEGPVATLPATETVVEGPVVVSGRPQWINIWATWCKPCVYEMPLIMRWRDARLGVETDISLQFVSADENPAILRSFLSRHADFRTSRHERISTAGQLPGLLKTLQLPETTALPVHIFTGRDGRIVCIRDGGVAESDLPIVRDLLQ